MLQMEIITEFGALVLPMVKHPFVVGFLVAELPELVDMKETCDIQIPSHPFLDRSSDITPYTKGKAWDFQTSGDQASNYAQLVTEWKNSVLMISRTLAMAYAMDQVVCSLSFHNISLALFINCSKPTRITALLCTCYFAIWVNKQLAMQF